MHKPLILSLATAATLLSAGAAHAGHVNWSIGINLPPIGTVISNGPVYVPAPVYYEPAPVYYEPAPVIYAPPPVVYRPAPRVIYAPPPVVYSRPVPIVYGGWGHHPHHQYRDSDRDGIPDRWDRYDNRKYPHQVMRDEYGDRRR
jgi:PXPV repeat (3 copies)